jgi:PKHD-type hydroxylase
MIYEIPPRDQYGKDFLGAWENFLTPEDINLILAQPEWTQAEDAFVSGKNKNYEVNPESRIAKLGWLYPKENTFHVWEKIVEAIAQVNRSTFHFDLTGLYEPLQLGTYTGDEKSHHGWHMDYMFDGNAAPRKLSMSLLLSDPSEFEGGELQIKMPDNENQSLEQAKGRAWFFPSYVSHRVTPVTKGTRKSVVLWVSGPPFK